MDPNIASAPASGSSPAPEAETAVHNASVDEDKRHEGVCAQVHLPTGRMCTLPSGHPGSCDFVAPDQVDASLAHQRNDAGQPPDA
jgi:hypothetical protein